VVAARSLRRGAHALALGCHLALLTAVAGSILRTGLPRPWLEILLTLASLPLLLTFPAVARDRRPVYPWLSLALVCYAGAATVEVIATSGTAVLSTLVLLAALLELGLLLLLLRSTTDAPRTGR
jgi:hypothetical protein